MLQALDILHSSGAGSGYTVTQPAGQLLGQLLDEARDTVPSPEILSMLSDQDDRTDGRVTVRRDNFPNNATIGIPVSCLTHVAPALYSVRVGMWEIGVVQAVGQCACSHSQGLISCTQLLPRSLVCW